MTISLKKRRSRTDGKGLLPRRLAVKQVRQPDAHRLERDTKDRRETLGNVVEQVGVVLKHIATLGNVVEQVAVALKHFIKSIAIDRGPFQWGRVAWGVWFMSS